MSLSRMRWLCIVPILIFLIGCGPQQEPAEIRFSNVDPLIGAPMRAPVEGSLRVAVASVLSAKETIMTYRPFLAYLSEQLGVPVELLQRQTYADINELIKAGNADLAMVCSGAYVVGLQEYGIKPLVIPQVGSSKEYRSLFIVPADSPAQKLADLRGKVFAFTDPMSFSGKIAPSYALWELKKNPEAFFQRYIYTFSHDNSVKAVAEKWVDGAAVDSMIFDYAVQKRPELKDKIKIIGSSEPVGNPPVVLSPRVDADLKNRLRNIFLNMHKDDKGKAVLKGMMIDQFVLPEEEAYTPIRAMLAKMGIPK